MIKIVSVQVLENYMLALEFDDGTRGNVDLSELVGKGVFTLWNDMEAFRSVQIGPNGELVWNDEIDLCPDALYLEVSGRNPDDVFPGLANLRSHA